MDVAAIVEQEADWGKSGAMT